MPDTCRSWRSKLPCPFVFSCLVSFLIYRYASRMRFMCRLQNFVGIRVIGRQQRQRSQVTEKIPKPETADGDGYNHLRQGHNESLGKIRFDDPEQIEIADQHQPDREPRQPANVALEGA